LVGGIRRHIDLFPPSCHKRFDVCYNACVLVGPEGFIGKYRKTHQPLTERLTFYSGSGDYPVYDTRIGRIGLTICFDKCYPEVTRTLALKGAQIILSPTCWPCITHSEDDPDFADYNIFSFARAYENMVFFAESNISWSGTEPMMGYSRIIGPNTYQICATTGFEEAMAVADVDIKAEVLKAKLYPVGGSDLPKDRKPATYTELTKPNSGYGIPVACLSPMPQIADKPLHRTCRFGRRRQN
jgi:predicted amidohydrolase